MMLTYGLTIIIVGAWLLKMLSQRKLIINRTPLDIPLLLFLTSQVLSTIFSIDVHTSIWGYYSRSNGGLLSLIAYLLLYWAFVSNITKDQVFKLLKIGLLSGFIISLWGIAEHFGVSPSCVFLRGEFNAGCWVQDVQSRVFATLGQPNWMAAYLGMLIFPAIYFFLTSTTRNQRILYLISLISLYLAFTFTYSRGGMLGFLAGLGVFLSFWLVQNPSTSFQTRFWSRRKTSPQNDKVGWRSIMLILGLLLLINLLFGSALTRFHISQFLHPSAPTSNLQHPTSSSVTQLENGGTESGQIRLIVWQGAIEIFKHYPIFGSGVETFAYSYYQFRPAAHNLTTEWDFLYNKAHNEFLNYLATTGIVGFSAYILMIITFIIFIIRAQREFQAPLILRKQRKSLLALTLLASYVSYLVQNFFGFSVVIIALFFFLFPAIAFVATDSTREFPISNFQFPILNWIYRREVYTKVVQAVILLVTCYLLLVTYRLWLSDTHFAKGEHASESGNPGRAYNELTEAVSKNRGEPYYLSELGYAAAASALALQSDDASTSAVLKNEAIQLTENVLRQNPNNTSFWRTAIRTYFELYGIDKSFIKKTLDTVDQTISLAPTDAKLYYNKAVILGDDNQNTEAIKALEKAIELKPNYRDAYFALALFQFDTKDNARAVETMNKVLQLIPGDPEALGKLNEWGKTGIATKSGKQP